VVEHLVDVLLASPIGFLNTLGPMPFWHKLNCQGTKKKRSASGIEREKKRKIIRGERLGRLLVVGGTR